MILLYKEYNQGLAIWQQPVAKLGISNLILSYSPTITREKGNRPQNETKRHSGRNNCRSHGTFFNRATAYTHSHSRYQMPFPTSAGRAYSARWKYVQPSLDHRPANAGRLRQKAACAISSGLYLHRNLIRMAIHLRR